MEPYSAAFMAAGSVAQAALKPASASNSSPTTIAFDSSGFAVNVGSGSASSSKTALPSPVQSAQAVMQGVGAVAAGVGGLFSDPLVIIGGAVALLFLMRK